MLQGRYWTWGLLGVGAVIIVFDYLTPATVESLDYPSIEQLVGGLLVGVGLGRLPLRSRPLN
jgi:hypothetical protein